MTKNVAVLQNDKLEFAGSMTNETFILLDVKNKHAVVVKRVVGVVPNCLE